MQKQWHRFNDIILGIVLFLYALAIPSYGITSALATLLLYKYWKVPNSAQSCTQRAIFIAIIIFGSVFMGLVIGATLVGESAWWWNIAIESAAWWVIIGLPIVFIGSVVYYKRNASKILPNFLLSERQHLVTSPFGKILAYTCPIRPRPIKPTLSRA